MKDFVKKIILKFVKNTIYYKAWKENKTNLLLQKPYIELLEAEKNAHKNIGVVNLNANDICNSKCAMCNIWEQKQGFEFSPQQVGTILQNDLFKDVKHIGVTGGEPTLREDLPEIYEEIIKALPNISALSTITNCIKEQDVKDRIDNVINTCKKYDKAFSMMVSLDGYKEIHDKIRGRKGNFESAVNVISYFKEKGVEVSTGSTISKDNVWEMDDLLDYMIENKIYGRFRVAEFIKRLYNDNKASVIRNFNEDETYNLILFFYKLIFRFEKNETYIRTYKSIINILSGGERLIGCPYHNNGVVLNSRGELAYCAPKSKIIGETLKNSANDLYNQNLDELQRIKKEDCKNCIHDYHAPITAKEFKIQMDETYWRNRINIASILTYKEIKNIPADKYFDHQIFITGWYGTETVGDKAILAGIIQDLTKRYQDKNIGFVITSLYPVITERTMKELNVSNYKVIPVYDQLFISTVKGSDLVVMGGGPLMDLEELALPLISFRIANKMKVKSSIFGCGIGPLMKEKSIIAVKEILSLADEIYLRDQKSITIANEWLGGTKTIKLSGDPAKFHLNTIAQKSAQKPKLNRLSCFLREWTHEYVLHLSTEEFTKLKLDLEFKLSEFIKAKAEELNVDEIFLDHMHNFVIGNDDRDFSRYFIKKYFTNYKIPISYNRKLSTIDSIVDNMKTSRYNICMRFHSVVFAHTLETDFTGFDYTNGGKIHNYLTDNNALQNLLSIENLIQK